MVFFSHIGLTRFVPGGFGVTVFFFLSGFLITTLLRLEAEQAGRVSLRNFYVRRALRILPLMYIVLASATVCTLLSGDRLSKSILALQALHLTNYQMLGDGLGFPIGTMPLWSLSVEEHFYLLFPISLLALRRAVSKAERQALVLLGACGVVLLWRCLLMLVFHANPEYVMHATDTRIDSVMFGCALALWKNPATGAAQWSNRSVWLSFAVALLVLAGSMVPRNPTFRETFRYTIQGLALAPVFIAVIRFPRAIPFRFLNLPAVSFVGVVSYGIYLVHLPIILLLKRTLWQEWIVTGVSLALAVALATLLHYSVERPCARLRRRFLHPTC
jgi:peptidoglycan/LPS O-acetylase OafA/YrhL